jgi:hypothetical protein
MIVAIDIIICTQHVSINIAWLNIIEASHQRASIVGHH